MLSDKTYMQGIALIEVVVNKKFTEQQVTIYKTLLEDIPENKFVEGINNLLRERVYTNIPAPAEIREYCLGAKLEDLSIKIAEATRSIEKAISQAGVYNDVQFADPVIHLLIHSFGGWSKLCKSSMYELQNWFKFEVPKLYKAYTIRKASDIPVVLRGIGEEKEVIKIGNPEKINNWVLSYENKIKKLQQEVS